MTRKGEEAAVGAVISHVGCCRSHPPVALHPRSNSSHRVNHGKSVLVTRDGRMKEVVMGYWACHGIASPSVVAETTGGVSSAHASFAIPCLHRRGGRTSPSHVDTYRIPSAATLGRRVTGQVGSSSSLTTRNDTRTDLFRRPLRSILRLPMPNRIRLIRTAQVGQLRATITDPAY